MRKLLLQARLRTLELSYSANGLILYPLLGLMESLRKPQTHRYPFRLVAIRSLHLMSRRLVEMRAWLLVKYCLTVELELEYFRRGNLKSQSMTFVLPQTLKAGLTSTDR